MKKQNTLISIVIVCLFSSLALNGQSVKAVVADKDTRVPIVDVFVFWDNSSTGSITDKKGVFELTAENYQNNTLVFSHLNYDLYSLPVKDIGAVPDTIFLTSSGVVLTEAVVTEKSKPRVRSRWLKRFKNDFLGAKYDNKLIRIKNPEVLLFKNEKGKLTAESRDALVIENKFLGYQVQFFLEAFESYQEGDLLYEGKVFFKELDGTKKEKARFKRNRLKTYQQTSRSFFTALVNQKMEEGNYEVGYSIFDRDGAFANYEPIDPNSLSIKEVRDAVYEISINQILTVTANQIKLGQSANKGLGTTLGGRVGNFKENQFNIPRSYLWSKHGRIVVNKFGTILNAKEVEEAGYWASLRVASLLPLDYKMKNKRKRRLQ